jgi:DNA-binding beta-propeller fold protein YncE
VIKSEATNHAWRIALSDNGDVYFTQWSIECYVHLDPSGSVRRTVKCIKNKFARGIEVESKTGSVFISGNHKLQKYNSCGELVKEIGDVTPGAQPGELHEPNDVRFHKNRIYICDSGNGRVQIFDLDLNYVHAFGTKGRKTGQLHWPEDIDFDTDGNAYIVDSGRECILLFSPTYQLIRDIKIYSTLQTTSPLRFPIALRVHGDYIYIGDAYQGVLVLACDKSTGKIIHHFSDSPVDVKGHSQVFPVGIAIDADGYVYVCQWAKHCLSVY